MPSTREIRRRIRSIRSTSQITHAMEMVAASKMRRAQQMVLASRPYSERIYSMIGAIAATLSPQEEIHPLLVRRPVRNVGLILITPDRGLCGALPGNVNRFAEHLIREDEGTGVKVITIGRKGRDWMVRRQREVVADLSGMKDRPTLLDTAPAASVAINGYTDGTLDRVDLVYTEFLSTVTQRPQRKQLLPIEPQGEPDLRLREFLFEPTPVAVLSQLLPRYVEVLVYEAALEAQASEQSARMVAMHNATENAKEIIQELTLVYNKARQAGITNEILEISAGAAALAAR